MKIRNLYFLSALFLLISCTSQDNSQQTGDQTNVTETLQFTSDELMQSYFDDQAEGEQVFIQAEIIKILRDDTDGSRHQKFIVELNSGQSILIAHNIDLAPRVANITEGDEIIIYGQYEWNSNGGVIHWTHHDPDGEHEGGWIEYQGEFYE